ncbi:N-acetylneuraminate synthase family protein [Clostridium sp.]
MCNIISEIKSSNKPFIIAEIGVNYYDIAKKLNISVFEAAKLMIREAKEAGADAAKFQSYKAEKIASKQSPAYWDQTEESTSSQYELFKKFDKFGKDEYEELAKYCNSIGIKFMSTPFDFESSDYLNGFMDIYKISSSDLTNLPFIEHMAKKQKPIFLSTGAATIGEIESAVNCILKTGNKDIAIMHCVLDYPTANENANLNMIKHLQEVFPGYLLGYSDHTKPDESMLILTTAYENGAVIIEKHFTLDKKLKGNDHYHAMDTEDLRKFNRNIELLKVIKGEYCKRPLECEQ